MGQEGWSAHADPVPGRWETDRFAITSVFADWNGSFLPMGTGKAELKHPTRLVEQAVQSTAGLFPFGVGTRPAIALPGKTVGERNVVLRKSRNFHSLSFHLSFHRLADGLLLRRQSVCGTGLLWEVSLRGC